MILYKNGLALIGGKLTKNDIVANHGKIIEIAPEIVADEQTEVVDCTGKYILPALVDIHTHGANGYDFNTADLDGMKKIMEFYVSHGVGTVFPTVMTDSDEVICRQVELICKLAQDYPEVKGINLEGPFLSPQKCGAMPPQYLQKPSVDKFMQYQKAANGFIKLVTVAPELPDAVAFISEVADSGVVVSLGHSTATAEEVNRALDAGAKSFTHFGNAMSQMDRLNLNMVGSAMASDAFAEVQSRGGKVACKNQGRKQSDRHNGQHHGNRACRRKLHFGCNRRGGDGRRRLCKRHNDSRRQYVGCLHGFGKHRGILRTKPCGSIVNLDNQPGKTRRAGQPHRHNRNRQGRGFYSIWIAFGQIVKNA